MLPPLNLARTYCPFQTCALDHLKRTCQIRIQSFPTISRIRNRFFLRRDSETPGGRVEGLSILRRERENAWIDTSRHYPQRQRLCTDSARTLINVRKSAVAEDPLQRVLKSEEATLIEQNPGLLRQLMSSLMTVFVEQKKIEAAETLRSRADALFLSKASTDEREALIRGFRLAHLFSRICSPQTPDGETLKQNWKASC
jgi:hypothetical protein